MEDLEGLFQDIPQIEKLVIRGDLNGHVGSIERGLKGVHCGYGPMDVNVEGKSILEFSSAFDLTLTNT